MVFDKLLRRRWQHPDAGVRRQAVAALEPGHPALRQLAQTDPDMGVRSAALSRMDDFDQVLDIGLRAEHRKPRDAAVSRLCGLLDAQDAPPDIAACLERLERAGLTGVAEKLCRRGRRPEARILAVHRIQDQDLLREIACEDPAADVRYAAVTGIHERRALDQVLRQARKKDKRVARCAKERLDALAAREQALHRMVELCEALEALRDAPTEDLRVKRLLDEAEPLRGRVNDVLRERLEQAHENWLESRARHERQRAEWAEAVAKHESLLDSMEQLAADLAGRCELIPQDEGILDAAIRTFQIGWEDADPLPATAKGGLDARYRALRTKIEERRDQLRTHHEQAEALRALDRQARACAETVALDREETLERLRAEAAALPWPQDKTLHAELSAQLRASLEDPRKPKQTTPDPCSYREIDAQLQALEHAVEQGEVKTASRAESRIKALLDACPSDAGADKRRQRIDARLRALIARLRALRDWRRWGSGQAREELLRHMETLPDRETDPEKLAKAVREARTAWQGMDKTGDRPEAGLWERFDQACTRAYAPCAAHFEARAKERAAHLEAREAVVTALATLARSVDWDAPDWKALERALRDLKHRWREAGAVDRKDWRQIEARYKAGLAPLEGPLQEERTRNQAERTQLIERVEALADAADLRHALEETKQAQRAWNVTAPQNRTREHKLWERFRAACDRIFERQKQQRETREQTYKDNLTAKQALCERAEALFESDDPDTQTPWRGLTNEWAAIGPVPKADARALEARWAKLETRAEQIRLQRRLRAIRKPVRDLQACLADLIAAEEALLRSEPARFPESLDVDDAPKRRISLLRQALEEGGAVLQPPAEQAQTEARALCIQAELLAGTPSPEEDAERRMQIQVARLQQALGEAQDTGPEARARQAAELERAWWLLGPMTREHRQALGARLERAWAVVWGNEEEAADGRR